MGSAIPQGELGEIVREARSRTGVPAVAAGLFVDGSVELAADGPVDVRDAVSRRVDLEVVHGVARVRVRSARRRDAAVALAHRRAALGGGGAATGRLPGTLVVRELGILGGRRRRARPRPARRSPTRCATRILEPLGLTATSYEEPPGAAERPPPGRRDRPSPRRARRTIPASRYPVRRPVVDGRRPAPVRRAPVRRSVRAPEAAGGRARRRVLPRLLAARARRAGGSRSTTRARSRASSRCC